MDDKEKNVIATEETFFGSEPIVISEEDAREFLGDENDLSVPSEHEFDDKKIIVEEMTDKQETIQTDDLSLKMEEVNAFEENEKLLEATATIPTSVIMEHAASLLEQQPASIEKNDESVVPIQPTSVEQPVTEISHSVENGHNDSARQVPKMDDTVMKSLENDFDVSVASDKPEPALETPVETPVEAPVETAKEVTVKTKKKHHPFMILLNIFATLFFLFILFEVVIAFLNFSMIKQDKEPSCFATKRTETKGEFDYTIYDMGLFKIVRKEDQKEYSIKLLPFFLEI